MPCPHRPRLLHCPTQATPTALPHAHTCHAYPQRPRLLHCPVYTLGVPTPLPAYTLECPLHCPTHTYAMPTYSRHGYILYSTVLPTDSLHPHRGHAYSIVPPTHPQTGNNYPTHLHGGHVYSTILSTDSYHSHRGVYSIIPPTH